jgi:hypothetical protein
MRRGEWIWDETCGNESEAVEIGMGVAVSTMCKGALTAAYRLHRDDVEEAEQLQHETEHERQQYFSNESSRILFIVRSTL